MKYGDKKGLERVRNYASSLFEKHELNVLMHGLIGNIALDDELKRAGEEDRAQQEALGWDVVHWRRFGGDGGGSVRLGAELMRRCERLMEWRRGLMRVLKRRTGDKREGEISQIRDAVEQVCREKQLNLPKNCTRVGRID